MLTLTVAGCGGGGASGISGAPAVRSHPITKRCDVQDANGEFYSTENDLRGINESLKSALGGKKTVTVEPGGPDRIRSYSAELLHSIHREIRDVRKILRSC